MARDLPRGDIPMLVLSVLAQAPSHGYAIARQVERLSKEALQLREGSLYPALRVMEQDGLITSRWENPPSGPARKVYAITEAGQTELSKRARDWKQYAAFMHAILGRKDNVQSA